MSDKTDIQALTEQIQALNANMQQLSSDMKEMKSANAAKSTTQVIRPSDFSVKINVIAAAVIFFVFSAMPIALFTSMVLDIKNYWAGVIIVCGAIACSYFFTKVYHKYIARQPIVNVENLSSTSV